MVCQTPLPTEHVNRIYFVYTYSTPLVFCLTGSKVYYSKLQLQVIEYTIAAPHSLIKVKFFESEKI